MNSKKEKELLQLVKTFDLLQLLNYSIIDAENETPDIIVAIGSDTIGVEITSLYRESDNGNSAKTQSDIPIIVEDSVHVYNQKGGFPITFGFGFDGKVSINNRNRFADKLGQFLYDYIRSNYPNGIDSIVEIDVSKFEGEGKQILSHIVAESNSSQKAIGFTTSGFDSSAVNKLIVEEALRKKELLIDNYKRRCEKIWLIISLPTMLLSADFKLEENLNINISHKFDAAYILDEYRGIVREI